VKRVQARRLASFAVGLTQRPPAALRPESLREIEILTVDRSESAKLMVVARDACVDVRIGPTAKVGGENANCATVGRPGLASAAGALIPASSSAATRTRGVQKRIDR
jgi:hypothetical protein